MDEEFQNALDSLKTAIDALSSKVDQLTTKQQNFEDKIQNEVIKPANDAYEKSEKDKRFGVFKEKYGARLDPLAEPMKALEGDDFDIYNETFNSMDGTELGDEFVDGLVKALSDKLDAVKEKLGLPQDAEVTVTETPDGEVKVEADGETVLEEKTEEAVVEDEGKPEGATDEVNSEGTESESESSDEGEEGSSEGSAAVSEDETEEDDEEELRKLMEELDSYKG